MTWTNNTPPKRRLSAKLAVGFAIAALLTGFGPSAGAAWRHDDRRGHNWGGGYYRAPPVVYGSTYGSSYYGAPGYYAPPVVYGPGIGINLPGISIGIR